MTIKVLKFTSLLLIPAFAQAAVTVDFDNTSDWGGDSVQTIVADPTDAGNDVSSFTFNGNSTFVRTYALGGQAIDNSSSDSFEFRFYVPQATGDSADHWFGFTQDNAPGGWGDMQAYFGIREDAVGAETNNTFDLFSQDGVTGTEYNTNLAADTWHTMVMVVDNSSDTYSLTLNGSSLATGLAFRTGTTNSLDTFAVWGQGKVNERTVLADAVVPEPATYALLAGMLTLGGVLMRRRMQR